MNDTRKNLVITRKYGETIEIMVHGEKISVTLLEKPGGGSIGRQARIAITANECVKILRSECGPYKEKK